MDVTSRKCEAEGCRRIPSFGFLGGMTGGGGGGGGDRGRVRFCAQHKLEGMEDYHKPARGCRAVVPGGDGGGGGQRRCNKTSSFGFRGRGGKRVSCAQHREKGEEGRSR